MGRQQSTDQMPFFYHESQVKEFGGYHWLEVNRRGCSNRRLGREVQAKEERHKSECHRYRAVAETAPFCWEETSYLSLEDGMDGGSCTRFESCYV